MCELSMIDKHYVYGMPIIWTESGPQGTHDPEWGTWGQQFSDIFLTTFSQRRQESATHLRKYGITSVILFVICDNDTESWWKYGKVIS